MKKVITLSFALVLVLTLFTACDPSGNDPMHAELRLVPLTTGDLAKAIVDEAGNQYLPVSEISAIMAKATSADIDFGNMEATKTLQYVLMNVGNTDVYDITFSVSDITIHPSNIALVPASDEGGDLIALPIVSFTKEHVLPVSGVGSLLDMEVGAFTDVLFLSYNYNIVDTASVDSFDITDDYTVSGTKMGALIDIQVSGQSLQDALQNTLSRYDLAGFPEPFYDLLLTSDDMDSMIVYNNGNAPLPMRIVNQYLYINYGGDPILDTLILAGGSIDISGIVRGSQYFTGDDNEHGNIIFFGADRDQPYIFEILGDICIDGEDGLLFTEQ
jgi:predicted small secreted protein